MTEKKPVIIVVDDSPGCRQIGAALASAMASAEVIIASGPPILSDPAVLEMMVAPIPEKKVQPWKRRAKWGKPWR